MARMRLPAAPSNLSFQGNVQIKGLREYALKLEALGDGMATTGCITALADGGEALVRGVRQLVPILKSPDPRRTPGTLRNAIQKLRVKTTRFAVTYVVGIKLLGARAVSRFKQMTRRKSADNPHDPFYGTVLEFGRIPRTQHPSIKPGFEISKYEAVRLSFERLKIFTLNQIARLGAK